MECRPKVCGLRIQVPAREWQYEVYGNEMRVVPADELNLCHMIQAIFMLLFMLYSCFEFMKNNSNQESHICQ